MGTHTPEQITIGTLLFAVKEKTKLLDEQQAKIDELVKALQDAIYWVSSQPSVAKEIMDKALTRAKGE